MDSYAQRKDPMRTRQGGGWPSASEGEKEALEKNKTAKLLASTTVRKSISAV